MLAQWTADVVGQMHKWKIGMRRMADHLGVSREYVSMVLNGHREPAGAEEKFRKAVDEIVLEIVLEDAETFRIWRDEQIRSGKNLEEMLTMYEKAGMGEYVERIRDIISQMADSD